MTKLVARFLLLYPSMPYLSFGWGTNIPFFVASLFICAQALYRKKFDIDRELLKYLYSVPLVAVATYIMYRRFGSMENIVPFIGLRELLTQFTILSALYIIFKQNDLKFIASGLFLGLLINLLYGGLEIFRPSIKVTAFDFIFHEPTKNWEYLLKEENVRIRMLWSEPSQAATYLVMALPLLLVHRTKIMKVVVSLLWMAAFIKVASKGVVVFGFLATMLFAISRFTTFYTIVIRFWWVFIVIGTIGTFVMYVTESELMENMDTIYHTLVFIFSGELLTTNLNEFYDALYTGPIGESQYIRLINCIVVIIGFFKEPYAFVTGFSPWGMKYIYYLHPEIVPDVMRMQGLLGAYTTYELHLAKHIVQSSFLDMYVSYGVCMFLFMLRVTRLSYLNFSKIFPIYKDYWLFLYFWFFLATFFMRTDHISVVLYTYFIFSMKCKEACIKGKQIQQHHRYLATDFPAANM